MLYTDVYVHIELTYTYMHSLNMCWVIGNVSEGGREFVGVWPLPILSAILPLL